MLLEYLDESLKKKTKLMTTQQDIAKEKDKIINAKDKAWMDSDKLLVEGWEELEEKIIAANKRMVQESYDKGFKVGRGKERKS